MFFFVLYDNVKMYDVFGLFGVLESVFGMFWSLFLVGVGLSLFNYL